RVCSLSRSSSPVRLPFVFSASRAIKSIVWRARSKLGSTTAPLGSGASPRWTNTEWPSERMKVEKSTAGSSLPLSLTLVDLRHWHPDAPDRAEVARALQPALLHP